MTIKQKINNVDWTTFPNDATFNQNAASLKDLSNNLTYLHNQIGNIKRELDFYDIYKFYDSAEESNYQEKYNNMPINYSLVINQEFEGEPHYKQGDVLIKTLQGPIHVPSKLSGVYVPSYNETTKKLTYTFANQGLDPDDLPKIDLIDNTTSSYYGINKSPFNNTITFDKRTASPVIKFYDINNEEVYWDYQLLLENQFYIINNIPTIIKTVVIK